MVMKAEPLLQKDIELARLKVALNCCIATQNVLKNGYGGVDPARLERTIALISEGYGLPRKPTVAEMFDGSFLPPEKDRMLKERGSPCAGTRTTSSASGGKADMTTKQLSRIPFAGIRC